VKAIVLSICVAAAVSVPLMVGPAAAQGDAYPTKVVRIVNDSAAGSANDASGRIIADKLSALWGQQVLTVNGKNIRITIPAGVENGQQIKLKGHGGPGGGSNGTAGDLYITFIIPQDASFRREGNDLHTRVQVDLYTALLGGDITVDTLGGKIKLKVKPETQNNTVMRLKGKGFPIYKMEGEYGDLYVTLDIRLPEQLSEKEKSLFRELAKLAEKKG